MRTHSPRVNRSAQEAVCGFDPGSCRDGPGRRRRWSSHHRVPHPYCRNRGHASCRGVSRPVRTATSGSPNWMATRSGGSPPPASSPSSPSPRPTASPLVSQPARTATSGSPNPWQQDRADHHGRRRHRVPDPHGCQPAFRHRSRPGWQSLVHRERRKPDRQDHHGRRHHRVPRPPTGSAFPWDPPVIAAGPDGNLWFTEHSANQIGRITTAGVITEFPIPTASSGPYGIAAGPDGNLWFAEPGANQIGRITTAGVVTEFPIPTASSDPGYRSRPGRQPLVHRNQQCQPDRSDHHGRRRHGVPDPTVQQLPSRYRGRPGRQPLVHRKQH